MIENIYIYKYMCVHVKSMSELSIMHSPPLQSLSGCLVYNAFTLVVSSLHHSSDLLSSFHLPLHTHIYFSLLSPMADPYLHKYKVKANGSSGSPALTSLGSAGRLSLCSSPSGVYQLRSPSSTYIFVQQTKLKAILAKAFYCIHGASFNAKDNRKKALGLGPRTTDGHHLISKNALQVCLFVILTSLFLNFGSKSTTYHLIGSPLKMLLKLVTLQLDIQKQIIQMVGLWLGKIAGLLMSQALSSIECSSLA